MTDGPLRIVTQLMHEGRFGDALRALPESRSRVNGSSVDVLRAEILERTGQLAAGRALAETILRARSVSASERSSCEFSLAKILQEQGYSDEGVLHLQRALSLAQRANDPSRVCWIQIRLLATLAGRAGPDATAGLLSDVHTNTVKVGDPRLFAALHVYVGAVDAKRGRFRSARRHTRVAQQFLMGAPNVWLEAVAQNSEAAIAIGLADFGFALKCACDAVELAVKSGVASVLRAAHGNLGNALLMTGEFDQAVACFERSFAALESPGEHTNEILDSLARVRIIQGFTLEAARLLDRIDDSARAANDRLRFGNRYAVLTRAQLLIREGHAQEATTLVGNILQTAGQVGDQNLLTEALLAKADVLEQSAAWDDLASLVRLIVSGVVITPTMYAGYEQMLASLTRVDSRPSAARRHYSRAKRIFASLNSVPGMMELERRWLSASGDAVEAKEDDSFTSGAADTMSSIATLLLPGANSALIAAEFRHLLESTNCTESVEICHERAETQTSDVLSDAIVEKTKEELVIKRANVPDRRIVFTPKPDIEAIATINTMKLLLRTIQDLEQARLEREERAALWPVDELPLDNGQAVAVGEMRKLMELARRIASTNVSVLITGESGTGKEILARAVHAFSARADKPFVPLNCTAIPRDMLESQMFGHRRGAFTGADRDHLGVVRAARDGTLFLDEIGEMGLDLQPKILRFLESGEISPLGEPEPVTVNVRIVAATNSDLEQLVRDGRFREDLFYRLNVFRLSIPPLRRRRDEIPALVNEFLRRAALEFNKGHIRITEETMDHLLVYSWPGNIRQLQNEVRRMVALAEANAVLKPANIAADIRAALPVFPASADGRHIAVSLDERLVPTLTRIETEMITLALRDHKGKVDAAARALGISRKGLYLKRQRLGL
jgi:DNA-binding NtrC family response regulator/tetratricopeptide (TPR) repeat protein